MQGEQKKLITQIQRKVFHIEKYIGHINGRCIFNVQEVEDQEIMTKRIIDIDVLRGVLYTATSIYIVQNKSLTYQEMLAIFNDMEDGKNKLRFMNITEKGDDDYEC